MPLAGKAGKGERRGLNFSGIGGESFIDISEHDDIIA